MENSSPLGPDSAIAIITGQIIDIKNAGGDDRLLKVKIREEWFKQDYGAKQEIMVSCFVSGRLLKKRTRPLRNGAWANITGSFRHTNDGFTEIMAHRIRIFDIVEGD